MGTNRLQKLGDGIWLVDGPEIKFYGIPFPTRMTVIRLQNGDLLLHSPIAYDASLAAELGQIGPIRHLVSPNWIHYAYIAAWAQAVPQATAWASPGVRERAASRNVDIHFDKDLEDHPPTNWAGQVDQLIVRGSRFHNEVVFFHRASRCLVLTDLIENMDPKNLPWWIRPFARIAGIVAPNGKMPLDIYLTFTGNRQKLARALGRMLSWKPQTVIVAHGAIFRANAMQELRRGFRNLTPLGPEE